MLVGSQRVRRQLSCWGRLFVGDADMSKKWGDSVRVRVPIAANLSHTGKFRWALKLIDRDIAPLVRWLNRLPGVRTIQSCSGHDHYEGTGAMSSGCLWFAVSNWGLFESRAVPILTAGRCIERVSRMYWPEDCVEIIFLGSAHGKIRESARVIAQAVLAAKLC